MGIRVGNGLGLLLLIAVVFGPGVITGIVLHNPLWAIVLPFLTIGFFLGVAAVPIGREVSPAEYADELERHLRGTDNDDEWDRTASVRVKNAHLEKLRRSLPDSFNDLQTEEDRISLQRIIDALREGVFLDVPSRR
jgi:hypothetical protein